MGCCWNVCVGLALASLLLIAIPLHYDGGSDDQLRSQFSEYVRAHNKSYRNNTEEYERRFLYFKESMAEIALLNAASQGPDEHRARFGPTLLSDMSKAEYSDLHLSDERAPYRHPRRDQRPRENEVFLRRKRALADVPTQFDWREKGYVGAIQDQGICGACWAFATVGTIESMAAIQTGRLQALSVQEMIDCARYGNYGCRGGDICLLLEWLQQTGAPLRRQSAYPLSGVNGACRLDTNGTGVTILSSTCDNLVGREDEIVSQLATHGPVAVAVNALSWQNYLGGVIQHHCSGDILQLNHAVQLVGYDLAADPPHYVARNSWGRQFGEAGYVRLALGTNMCGLANEVAAVRVRV